MTGYMTWLAFGVVWLCAIVIMQTRTVGRVENERDAAETRLRQLRLKFSALERLLVDAHKRHEKEYADFTKTYVLFKTRERERAELQAASTRPDRIGSEETASRPVKWGSRKRTTASKRKRA